MITSDNLDLGSLEETLNRVPFSLSLSNLSAADHPLIFMNLAFREMTGCTDAHFGQNCRFLQGAFDNTEARAEIRSALADRRRTQVVLKNQRMDGSVFSNLLLLEHVGQFDNFPDLAVGTQFVLTKDEEDDLTANAVSTSNPVLDQAKGAALRIRLERRRIASDSAVRLLQSWCILNDLTRGSV